jgi:hypothetical protein
MQVEPKAGVLRAQDGVCRASIGAARVYVSQERPAGEAGREVLPGWQRDQEVQKQQLWQCNSGGEKRASAVAVLWGNVRSGS